MRKPLLVLLLLLAPSIPAQQPAASSFDLWVRQQLLSGLPVPHGSEQQKDSPAADSRSTALVDNTAAPSLLSVAATLVPGTTSTASTPATQTTAVGAGTGTITVSLFAILAGIKHVPPLEPVFYRQGVNARRLFFTGGSASSSQATDNTSSAGAVLGAKVLLVNQREIYTARNQRDLNGLIEAFLQQSAPHARMLADVRRIMLRAALPGSIKPDGTVDLDRYPEALTLFSDERFPDLLHLLLPSDLDLVRDRIANLREAQADLQNRINSTYDRISQGMQISASYTTNLRPASGYNTHREQIIFDYGLHPHINWTVNASADLIDRKGLRPNSQGGRLATEFQGDLTHPPKSSRISPLAISFSAEGDWATAVKPSYTGQAKISIPLLPGIDLPLAYRYANRAAQVDSSESKALLGLSLDLSRLLPSAR